MRSGIAGAVPVGDYVLARHMANDLDCLAASLHARRSSMFENERLDNLSSLKELPDLFQAVFPNREIDGSREFQHMLIDELVREISGFHAYMAGPGMSLIDWTLIRFQAENVKLLLRSYFTKKPVEDINGTFVSLPRELALEKKVFKSAESIDDFVRSAPRGFFRDTLGEALKLYPDYRGSFFFEAMLDKGYFHTLAERVEKIPGEERDFIRPIVCQEIDIFHLMLVARGRFFYNLSPEMLQPLHVGGSRITRSLFSAMLRNSDLNASVSLVSERVLDTPLFREGSGDALTTVDASVLEGQAWRRFYRLSNLSFRKSHMGLGTVIGYIGLRRVEAANLIAISEGIRNGVGPEKIRRRLISRNTA